MTVFFCSPIITKITKLGAGMFKNFFQNAKKFLSLAETVVSQVLLLVQSLRKVLNENDNRANADSYSTSPGGFNHSTC